MLLHRDWLTTSPRGRILRFDASMKGSPRAIRFIYGITGMAGLQSGVGRTMIESVVWAQHINVTDTHTDTHTDSHVAIALRTGVGLRNRITTKTRIGRAVRQDFVLRRVIEGKIEDRVTRPSDDEERQPNIWTTERNGSVPRRLVSLEYWTCPTAEHLKKEEEYTTAKKGKFF